MPLFPPATSSGASETFTPFIALDHSSTMVVPSSSGAVLFVPDASAVPALGAVIAVSVPATHLTSASFAARWAANVGAYDPSMDDAIIFFECVADDGGAGGKKLKATVQVLFKDTTAPTIASATVTNAAASSLVVVFLEAVTAKDQSQVSLLFSVGTPKTISGPPTGLGTNTLTYPLSGAIQETDVFSVKYDAGHTYQDLNGNALANVTQAVTNSVFASLLSTGIDYLWEATTGLNKTGAGPDFSLVSWIDQVHSVHINPGSASGVPTVNTTDTNGTDSVYFNDTMADTGAVVDLSGTPTVSVYLVIRDYNAGGSFIFEHGNNFSTDQPAILLADFATSGAQIGGVGGLGGDGTILGAAPSCSGALRIVKVVYDTTQTHQVKLWVTNDSGAFIQKTETPDAVTNVGNFAAKLLHLAGRAGSASSGGNSRWQALGIYKRAVTGTEDTAVHAAWSARFGLP